MAVADNLISRIKAAAVTAILGLELAGDDPEYAVGDRVLSQWFQDESNTSVPAILVTIEDRRIEHLPGGTEYRDKKIPVRVTIHDDVQPNKQHELEATYLDWRLQIRDIFHQQRLPGVQEVYWCEEESSATFDPAKDNLKNFICGLEFKFFTREPRIRN